MSGNVQELVCTIESIVRERGQVLGSQLAAELRRREAGWSPAAFGVISLRQFIEENVTTVTKAGRSGMDVLYAPADAPPPVVTPPGPSSEDIWRIWVSPHSHLALEVDRVAGNANATSRDAIASEGKVVLRAPDVAAHREIARSFVTRAPSHLQDSLQAAVDSSDENWWRAWRARLQGTEFWNEWAAYRQERFEQMLAERLRADGFDDETTGKVVTALRDNRAKTALQAKQTAREAKVVGTRERTPAVVRESPDLRRLVTDIVQHMTDAELRELRFPLGLVLDAIAAPKKS